MKTRRVLISVTVSAVVNERGVIVGSTIEYRFMGILLYKKEYHNPPLGSLGEFFSR
jgi:hypothetical protein